MQGLSVWISCTHLILYVLHLGLASNSFLQEKRLFDLVLGIKQILKKLRRKGVVPTLSQLFYELTMFV
jgi:hypothetical protein